MIKLVDVNCFTLCPAARSGVADSGSSNEGQREDRYWRGQAGPEYGHRQLLQAGRPRRQPLRRLHCHRRLHLHRRRPRSVWRLLSKQVYAGHGKVIKRCYTTHLSQIITIEYITIMMWLFGLCVILILTVYNTRNRFCCCKTMCSLFLHTFFFSTPY